MQAAASSKQQDANIKAEILISNVSQRCLTKIAFRYTQRSQWHRGKGRKRGGQLRVYT